MAFESTWTCFPLPFLCFSGVQAKMLAIASFSWVLLLISAILRTTTAQRGLLDQIDADNLLVDSETYKAACPEFQNYAAFPQYDPQAFQPHESATNNFQSSS